MPRRVADTCCMCHQALTWSSALTAASSASSFRLPRVGAAIDTAATASAGLIGTAGGELGTSSIALEHSPAVPGYPNSYGLHATRRRARPPYRRPPRVGHRPLQLPLSVLHAGRRARLARPR